MPLPALTSSSSAAYLPLSAEVQQKYRHELDRYILSFRLRPSLPFYSKGIGKMLAVLGAHEAACQFFEFASILECSYSINSYTVDFFRSKMISFRNENYTQDAIIGSFIVISEPSPQDFLLLNLMDSMGIDLSKREEFRDEFDKLAQRYRPQKQLLLPRKEKAKESKTKNKKRAPLEWKIMKLPDGLKWPSRNFSDAAKLGISIIEHLEEEWKDLIAAGIATRHVVESVDDSTLTGIENYRYAKSSKRLDKADRVIPAHLLPLTKKEALDRAIMHDPTIALTNPRVARTLGGRAIRADRRKKLLPIPLTLGSD